MTYGFRNVFASLFVFLAVIAFPYATHADETKSIVVAVAGESGIRRIDHARGVVKDRRIAERNTVLFSPVFGEMDYESLASWILEDRLPIRLQLQLHKHIWEPTRRGV